MEKPKKETTTKNGFYNRLMNVQLNCPKIDLDGSVSFNNTRYKYATLPNVLKIVRPLLAENKLMVYWIMDGDVLKCVLRDVKGTNFIESTTTVPTSTNPKVYGANITYLKRYLLLGLLGIMPDEDDSEINRNEAASKPALSDAGFNSALKRIGRGESGVIDQCKAYFTLTADQETSLHLAKLTSEK